MVYSRLRRDKDEFFKIFIFSENIDNNILFSIKKDRIRGHHVK